MNTIKKKSPEKNNTTISEGELILGISRKNLNKLLYSKPAAYKTLDEAFASIKPMKKGWYKMDGIEGAAVTAEGIERIKKILNEIMKDKRIPIPFIFPYHENEGSIIEWHSAKSEGREGRTFADICISMLIDFDEEKIEIDADNISNYFSQEITMSLNDEKKIEKIIEFLTRFFTKELGKA